MALPINFQVTNFHRYLKLPNQNKKKALLCPLPIDDIGTWVQFFCKLTEALFMFNLFWKVFLKSIHLIVCFQNEHNRTCNYWGSPSCLQDPALNPLKSSTTLLSPPLPPTSTQSSNRRVNIGALQDLLQSVVIGQYTLPLANTIHSHRHTHTHTRITHTHSHHTHSRTHTPDTFSHSHTTHTQPHRHICTVTAHTAHMYTRQSSHIQTHTRLHNHTPYTHTAILSHHIQSYTHTQPHAPMPCTQIHTDTPTTLPVPHSYTHTHCPAQGLPMQASVNAC